MHEDDTKWLGVATPFGGIRYLKRSGQGLLGQSEELEDLLTKVLKEELQAGSCCKIADDIFIGGQTHQQAATTYATILGKLGKSQNRRRQNPYLSPVCRHLRLGMESRRLPTALTPQAARPQEHQTGGHHLHQGPPQLGGAVQDVAYSNPPPSDHHGSQKTPSIGHVLYAIVNGQRKPVQFHSVKLPENCTKWSPCEIEALAFATGIQAELDLIKESTKPLLKAPDSSPVKDTVNLIKKGKFSAGARIYAFIMNINRVPVAVIHDSGKANLNAVGDIQSQNRSPCSTQNCTICTFVSNSIDTVLRPNATLGAISLYNTDSWAVAQRQNSACRTAIKHLRTGKQPSNKIGNNLL